MEHFVNIVMDKKEGLTESLDESIFPNSLVFESVEGATIYRRICRATNSLHVLRRI
jgi:hypothetical protein